MLRRKRDQRLCLLLGLSIGTEWGPRIGLQKGPLCG